MTKDKRQIHLDPMEWRDAMRKVPGKPLVEKAPAENRTVKDAPIKRARRKNASPRKKG